MPLLPSDHPRVESLARALWDYLVLREPLTTPVDVIIILGGNDLRTPRHAAKLFLRGCAPLVVTTGGIAHQGDLLETRWSRAEAVEYAEAAIAEGVPRDRIMLEPNSTNTGENLRFARDLLEARGLPFNRLLIVTKPPMERRAKATAEIVFGDREVQVSSPALDWPDYPDPEAAPLENVIHIMIGDFLRMEPYADRGYQTRQIVPAAVREAVDELLHLGYDRHLPR